MVSTSALTGENLNRDVWNKKSPAYPITFYTVSSGVARREAINHLNAVKDGEGKDVHHLSVPFVTGITAWALTTHEQKQIVLLSYGKVYDTEEEAKANAK